ncbi:MAG TPA: two-component system sensor histidine kinase KdbD, partial [Planctomycetota bacterium]|nr:two-component system sensor histidine kinase KdbD [Planctomycetota bacterium]
MSEEAQRPDPDRLLAAIRKEEERAGRGRLKIFFGASAGVGKTYTMLEDARKQSTAGRDVVVGYVEPHGRLETEALLAGLEQIPWREVEYRGVALREFDVDAALARRPQLLVVDELAHTNAPGSRHAKRWQDVDDLLAAGIDVYSTLNVQHLESLNDIVAQITGVVVRETLPDDVFERADEVELVDLTVPELLERLRQGKVYVADQAERAAQGFFRKPNLIALRELALRRTADRVNVDVLQERDLKETRETWPTRERVLVCVSQNVSAARVIRAGRRLARALRADWIAVTVETPFMRRLTPGDRAALAAHLR